MTTDEQIADIVYVGFLTGHGGDAVQMLHLAHGMHRRGHRVQIVVPAVDTSLEFAAQCLELGIPCTRTELIRADISGPRQNLVSMVRLIRSSSSEVIHFHTGNSCLPRTVMAALTITRTRRAFATLQSPYETITPDSWRAKFWSRAAHRRLHAVVSPSDHGTAFQRSCGVPENLAVTIHNAIDTVAIAGGDGAGPRSELGLGSDDPLIVFTSRMDSQKRPVDAVQMLTGVADDFPDARLVFVGTGTESNAVSAAAHRLGVRDRVHLVGFRTDIADWLAAATVWILPTERENFSVAVLEALAAGCAVLSTNCPGNTEVLVDGDNSSTFDVGDVDTGTERLRDLLASASLRERLSTRGIQSVQQYSVDHMVDRYEALYQRYSGLAHHGRTRAVAP